MVNSPRIVSVTILDEGTVHIHDEPLAVPAGANADQVVMNYLHLEAAGHGHPITVHIDDRRHHIQASLVVNPDGTHETSNQPVTGPGLQLDEIHTLTMSGHLDEATRHADGLLLQWSTDPALGPAHPHTLEAAETRAHLAWIRVDYSYAYRAWSWIAAAWRERYGLWSEQDPHDHTHCRRIAIATSNAAAAWMRMPSQTAAALGEDILTLLHRNSGNSRTPAGQRIRDRLAELRTGCPRELTSE
ncbi:hypothetical protein [Streptomyces rhizosphaericus]|uniref:hypothetical protein n=1 Tax=Streptomyces rhizosphaericus TaxID=114699 RepID=UPI000A38BAD6|nr:hypothetical protein [Streptomyces rhizosphaericus]